MILTFIYAITTSIQSRRISSLKTRIRSLLQGDTTSYLSIMFYNKTLLGPCKESKSSIDDCEIEDSMTSFVCSNKSDARLENLLWYRGDKRLCTIYPQQNVDVSNWLTYHCGRTFFPLHTTNDTGSSFEPEEKLHILVEADLESFEPAATTKATKVEDYGFIITWMANKNINLIIETDVDSLVKFFIASMGGECYINNGLLLKRIQTVLISGKPCFYDNDILNASPAKWFLDKTEWESHIEKLRILSKTASLATQQRRSLEVAEFPGVVIHPEDTGTDFRAEHMERIAAIKTLENETVSCVSIAASINIPQDNQRPSDTTDIDKEETLFQKVSPSPSKSNDVLDNANDTDIKLRPESCIDIKTTSGPVEQKHIFTAKDSKRISPQKIPHDNMSASTQRQSSNVDKPLNVLIFADTPTSFDNVKTVLSECLGSSRYCITSLSVDEARGNKWVDAAVLVVVCGNVGTEIGNNMVEYILRGGKLLALCSDILYILLPSFKTAEVRKNELVYFSYGKWKHVRMMHHILCYQASPVRARFSQDQEDVKSSGLSTPTSTNVKDRLGNSHLFDVEVLGTEETWHTPSILLASTPGQGGKIVFSQIHLEVAPKQNQLKESEYKGLLESNAARIEILKDLLNEHLEIDIVHTLNGSITYTPGFFLGYHESKLKMLEELKSRMDSDYTLKLPRLHIQFCQCNTYTQPASFSFLPVMVHQCPENFSTIEYYENLTTKQIGRLVIYADIMSSTMNVTEDVSLQHGLAVIAGTQTQGRGRSRNQWLSPKGAALYTLQVHVNASSVLGRYIPIIQHLACVSVVTGIRSLPGYEDVDIRLKWPNDIYIGKSKKCGGAIVTTTNIHDNNICNIGVGVNLSNSEPVGCINDEIKLYNELHNKQLKLISLEQYFAITFNETEKWINTIQEGDMDDFLDAYYKYWNHDDEEVTILRNSRSEKVKILGINESGYLRVRNEDGYIHLLHPDGNRFDMLKGLITEM